jgi:hypothetical protein
LAVRTSSSPSARRDVYSSARRRRPRKRTCTPI